MTPRGLNAPDIRRGNRAGLLGLVHRHGAIARNDLAKALGLTRAAVTFLVNDLLSEGWLEEAGAAGAAGHAGRRKIFLRIRPDAGKLIGIGVDHERVQVVLADMSGTVLASRTLPSPAVPSLSGAEAAGPLLGFIREAVAGLLGGTSPAGAGVLAVGLGVTGRVDPESGVSLREPRLWDGPVVLKEPLEAMLGVPVVVDNNVRSLALAEMLLTGMRAEPPHGFFFVKYGPGVGAAWLVGGNPWRGSHLRAGELGHTLVELDGPSCPYCGRHGCLESLVSARALSERQGWPGRTEELVARLLRERPEEAELLAARFARALGNAIELYDPGTVSLYGAPFRIEEFLQAVTQRVEANGRPCELARSALDPELPAIGGVALALNLILSEGAVKPENRA